MPCGDVERDAHRVRCMPSPMTSDCSGSLPRAEGSARTGRASVRGERLLCSRATGRANGERQRACSGTGGDHGAMPWQRKGACHSCFGNPGISQWMLSRPGDARAQRLRARCWRLPWTEPDRMVMQGSRGTDGKLNWQVEHGGCRQRAAWHWGTLPAVPDPAAESIGNGWNRSALLYLVHTRLPAARTLQRIRPTLRACCAAQQDAGCGLGLPRAGCCAELAMQWCSASRLGRRSM